MSAAPKQKMPKPRLKNAQLLLGSLPKRCNQLMLFSFGVYDYISSMNVRQLDVLLRLSRLLIHLETVPTFVFQFHLLR